MALTGGALFSGTLLSRSLFASKPVQKTGVQLFTLRNEIEEQGIEAVLQNVAEIGYNEVETFGYSNEGIFGVTPAEFKTICENLNIGTPSGHYLTGRHNASQTGTLQNGWDQAIEDAKKMGHEYMVIAWLHPSERKSIAQYKQLADMLNKAGEKCAEADIQLGYHNHDFEFQRLNGAHPYNFLLKQTDPDLVQMELDLYWIVKAGEDPKRYFKEHPGRFPLWHVKDLDAETGEFTEVGNGRIDFSSLFDLGKEAGLEHFFIEQDVSENPLQSIEISYKNVQDML